jgi:hypothetical protein
LEIDWLERRWVPASGTGLPDGVDSLAVGDVNGDRIVDIAVAGREDGNSVVDIYDGRGEPADSAASSAAAESTTHSTVNLLAQLVNPLGQGVGPMSVALGDFTGSGVSELAVASTDPTSVGLPLVQVYRFQLATPGAVPLGAPVTPVPVSAPFTPPALFTASGLRLTAADVEGNGVDSLIIGPAQGGGSVLDIMGYQATSGTWQLQSQLGIGALNMSQGVFLSAGDLEDNGSTEIAVGSRTEDQVDLLNASGAVLQSLQPLKQANVGALVAIVTAVNEPGALVVTPNTAGTSPGTAVIIPAGTDKPQKIRLSRSPGPGGLVPLGGGYVYQRSTIKHIETSLPISDGPATPTVLFGSSLGSKLVVQGFTQHGQRLKADKKDRAVEPILSQATPGTRFYPLEQPGDLPGHKTREDFPLVAYPSITYQSPFSIDLSSAPASVQQGLLPTAPFVDPGAYAWGPKDPKNPPPTIPQGQQADTWLEQRLLTAYNQAIGVAYQHHHNPYWVPRQTSTWNAVNIGYQSQGIDCTNLTAWAYNDALGIHLDSDTPKQASISATHHAHDLIDIPAAIQPYVQIQTLPGPTGTSPQDYANFVSSLQPGDILFINPSMKVGAASDPKKCTHAITWLGSYGVDQNGVDPNLIVDSTGDQPLHVDSNDHAIPGGVHVRPFAAPNAEDLNQWYYLHVDHVLRLIVGS